MRGLLFILMMFITTSAVAQSDFLKSTDKENGAVVLQGAITVNDLKNEPSFSWLKSADSYTPDAAAVSLLRDKLQDRQLVVFLGTWCEDSQNIIPRLLKTLSLAGYPADRIKIYGVDRNKQAKNKEKEEYTIDKVPTIIVYKDNAEQGRIVELPKKSVEKDLAEIVQAD